MFSTDEHGLTQPTAQQEQDWAEANDSPAESPEPDGPAPAAPPLKDLSPEDDDLPF